MSKVYLLLGGNLGDKRQLFAQTAHMLHERVGSITRQSAIYETEPWGFVSEDMFWNQVLELDVNFSPEEVLKRTQQIEGQLGRIRKPGQYHSRLMDIDLLFYDDKIVVLPELVIPHPKIQERKFVLVPLHEIVPEMVHPGLKKSIRQLLTECRDSLKVEKVKGGK